MLSIFISYMLQLFFWEPFIVAIQTLRKLCCYNPDALDEGLYFSAKMDHQLLDTTQTQSRRAPESAADRSTAKLLTKNEKPNLNDRIESTFADELRTREQKGGADTCKMYIAVTKSEYFLFKDKTKKPNKTLQNNGNLKNGFR